MSWLLHREAQHIEYMIMRATTHRISHSARWLKRGDMRSERIASWAGGCPSRYSLHLSSIDHCGDEVEDRFGN
eukprot:5441446-Pyramimonas_sp.AAC.1